nr:uncharacterized protein LOC122270429 [Parasteatoda tepidariorum]
MKHLKSTEGTWPDFYHELSNYFDGWITGLKVDTFEKLKDLIITDQMKKRVPQEFKEYYLDEWSNITSPVELAGKLEEFDDVRKTIKSKDSRSIPTKPKVLPSPPAYRKNFTKYDNYRTDRVLSERYKNFRKDNVYDRREEYIDSRNKDVNHINDRRETGIGRTFDKRRTPKRYECGSSNHLCPHCPKLRNPKDIVNINRIVEG